jgi:hypothetical protein
MSTRPVIAGLVLLLGCVPYAGAQTEEQGLKISGVSFSETYFSQGVPAGITPYNDLFIGSGYSVTAAASIKWSKIREKSFTNIQALPAFSSRFGDLKSKTWNQAVSLRHVRLLAPKWTLSLAASGQVMTLDEALYGESTLTQIATTAITFDDLAGALLRGKSSDPVLSDTANGALQPDHSLEAFLYGRRTANLDARAMLAYNYSPRLTFNAVMGGLFVRHLKDPSDLPGFIYPKVNSTSFGIGATYSLSPRTLIGVSANLVRSQILEVGSVTTNAIAGSINRTLSQRWFVQASLGLGSENTGGFRHLENRYSAGVGYKTYSHTVLFTYDRGLNDPYAQALASLEHSRSLTGTWHWARPGSPWSVNSAISQLIAIYRGVPGTNTWLVTESVSRRISRNYSFAVLYTTGRVGAKRYIQDGRQYQLDQTGIRTSFIWSPQRIPHNQ